MKLIIITLAATTLIIATAIWFIWREKSYDCAAKRPMAEERAESNRLQTTDKESNPVVSDGIKRFAAIKVAPEATEEMKHVAMRSLELLEAAPDDPTGKRSQWFGPLKAWQKKLEFAMQTGKREDLFSLVPFTASFLSRDRNAEPLAAPMDEIRECMEALGYHIIRELGKDVAENGGTLDAPTATIAIQVFAVRGFDNEPDWENEKPPIDSAGVLIARPGIIQLLQNLPPDQLAFFLRADSAEMFFRRYEPSGDGMPSLRKRYHDNREALQSDYMELTNKAAKH